MSEVFASVFHVAFGAIIAALLLTAPFIEPYNVVVGAIGSILIGILHEVFR